LIVGAVRIDLPRDDPAVALDLDDAERMWGHDHRVQLEHRAVATAAMPASMRSCHEAHAIEKASLKKTPAGELP